METEIRRLIQFLIKHIDHIAISLWLVVILVELIIFTPIICTLVVRLLRH